jgi:allantoin racemase
MERLPIGYVMGAFSEEDRRKRVRAVQSRADPSIELRFYDVETSMELRNWTPDDTAIKEQAFVEAFRRAERDGCRTVVPDGMLDLGVEGGRSAVDIPVVAPFEAAVHLAACVGNRIGILQYTSGFVPAVWGKVRKYGVGEFVVDVAAIDVEMVDLAAQLDLVRERTVALGRRLVRERAVDVVIPTGPGLCPVTIELEWLAAEVGVPVVEGMGAPLHVAASLVRLGLAQSRVRWPKAR